MHHCAQHSNTHTIWTHVHTTQTQLRYTANTFMQEGGGCIVTNLHCHHFFSSFHPQYMMHRSSTQTIIHNAAVWAAAGSERWKQGRKQTAPERVKKTVGKDLNLICINAHNNKKSFYASLDVHYCFVLAKMMQDIRKNYHWCKVWNIKRKTKRFSLLFFIFYQQFSITLYILLWVISWVSNIHQQHSKN